MKLKLSVSARGGSRDVLVTADAAATVGDVARELAATLDPELLSTTVPDAESAVTLRVHRLPTDSSATAVLLDPQGPLGDSALPSGSSVTVSSASDLYDVDGHRRGEAVAVLRVLAGPDAGREFPLPSGSVHLGRDETCDIRLTDRFVSKRHVRVSVTDVVEVIDLGSANGTVVAGERVQRVDVRPSDVVEIGDTTFSVTPLVRLKDGSRAFVDFNRSPLVQQVFAERELVAPDPPGPPRPFRFPVLALAGPVMMAVALFAVVQLSGSRTSPLLFVMMGLSPVLMVGAFMDQRRQAKVEQRESLAEFGSAIEDLRRELAGLAELEVQSRQRETPSTADGLAAAETLGRELWSRRPDRPGFLDVRLGIGRVPSRTTVKLPDERRSRPEHWSRLAALRDDFATVDGVPVVASLRDAGGLGVAGPPAVMIPVARAVLAQLACLHSPAELAIVAVGSGSSAPAWDWLKWLPHVGSAHSPVDDLALADNAAGAERLVAELEELCVARAEARRDASDSSDDVRFPHVILVVLDDAPVDRSRLVGLAEHGPADGVHVLWCAERVSQVPAACRSFVEVDERGHAESGQVHLSEIVDPIRCESLAEDVAAHLARRLAPVVDAGARIDDVTDLPRAVSFLSTLGSDLAVGPDAVAERWIANDPTLIGKPPPKDGYSLRAVVGQSSGDAFALDLQTHGPHALVGGTTGSGKSEFLQTWVLSLAAAQSPRRVTFLFVDYKGGSAFARCTELPHCVGMVTDLDEHLVRRALTSLAAELTYRETLIKDHGAKDIADLESRPDAPQLPRLLIVVDEFAALRDEIPEFVDGLVNIAQRGRSLGLHLILATQRPSGVISGNLRANTNLRVALRMADSDDSADVLGDPMSAGFDPAIPGRAAAKTGPGRISVFQSLYAGGTTPQVAPRPAVTVQTLAFTSPQILTPSRQDGPRSAGGASDLDRTVDQVIAAAGSLNLPAPRRPWQPSLAAVYDFVELAGQRTDAELLVGLQDVPKEQTSHFVHFRPDVDGNMAVIGTGGSGKSTALRTLAVAAGGTVRGGPCDVYALDFGSRGLSMLADLPNVGAVIAGSDHERIARLLRWLRDEIDLRARRYAEVSASTITEYRSRADRPHERRLLVLVDGLGAFRQDYELGSRVAYWNLFGQLASDGRAVGVHFVVTADRPSAVPASLAATIQRRLVLRLSSKDDYGILGIAQDVLSAESPPGRGVMDGLEVQVATLGASASLPRQFEELTTYASFLRSRGRFQARPIERLAERVGLTELPPSDEKAVVVGVGDEDLKPFAIGFQGSFLVTGPPSSGRTTALATLTQSARRGRPRLRTYLLSGRRSSLLNVDSWSATAGGEDEVVTLASRLSSELVTAEPGSVLVLIEAFDALVNGPAEAALEGLVKLAVDHDHVVVGEAEIGGLGGSYLLASVFRQARRGLLLQPDELDGLNVFKQATPRASRSEFPPGRGVVVDAGRATRVQIALPE